MTKTIERPMAEAPAPSANHRLPWIAYANSAEKADIEALQQNATRLDEQRRLISIALDAHRDRCLQRRGYRERLAAKKSGAPQ